MHLSRRAIRWGPFLPSTRRRLIRELDDREYDQQVQAARTKGDTEKLEEIHWRKQQDDLDEYEWSEIQYTSQLRRRAREFRVPVPPRRAGAAISEHWQLSQIHGERYLTTVGIITLREGIRAEERWRREQRAHYLAWIAPITGLVGALTGMIAIWRHFALKGP